MSDALPRILAHLRREPSRTWSIIVTLYGDAIVPRGGVVWLGTLLKFFDALGIGEGVVRTAVSRLAADGWLTRERAGRNSFYRLAARGAATFSAAATRIYDAHPPAWDGTLDLVVLGPDGREAARAALAARGYGAPAADLWVRPGPQADGALAGAIHLTARPEGETARRLAALAWPLARLSEAYGRFVATFAPLGAELDAAPPADLDALVARIMLIHEYRRIILRDPLLPAAFLPSDWPGLAARTLCGDLYPRLLPASERWLDVEGLTEAGPLPQPKAALQARFGRGTDNM
jgi:phenylacetic acid degradation operon negative regulatory protein